MVCIGGLFYRLYASGSNEIVEGRMNHDWTATILAKAFLVTKFGLTGIKTLQDITCIWRGFVLSYSTMQKREEPSVLDNRV